MNQNCKNFLEKFDLRRSMNRFGKILLILSSLFIANVAEARIAILACEPELGALAREIVGKYVDVANATRANQNPALLIARDTKLNGKITRAYMVFCYGGGLEDEWLPDLIRRSGNFKIRSGESVLMASDYVNKINNPNLLMENASPKDFKGASGGDKSSSSVDENVTDANKQNQNIARPHLNPKNMINIAAAFTNRIKIIDPANAKSYQDAYEQFVTKWNQKLLEWQEIAAPLSGSSVMASNDSWIYLAEWLNFNLIKIEEKNGLAISHRRVRELISALKNNPPKMILYADFEDNNIKGSIAKLSQELKVRVVFLPFTVGGTVGSEDIYKLYENTVRRLVTDCSKVVCSTSDYRSLSDYIKYDKTNTMKSY